MRAEYLLFDLAILAVPFVVGAFRFAYFYGRLKVALRCTLLAALPFIAWDAAVAGRHWWWNPAYVLGPELVGMPIEELLFFLAVPLTCLFTWERLLGGDQAAPHREPVLGRLRLEHLYPLVWLLVPLGIAMLAQGREYTGIALLALGGAALLDHALGVGLLVAPRALGFFGAVLGLTVACNGYLTARPVVLYDERYQLGLRLGTIPVEDFAFGFALVWLTTLLYQRRLGRRFLPSWSARAIRRAFGGYRHVVYEPDARLPLAPTGAPRRVAVIGAGLAGLGAAMRLAQRGVAVTLFERNDYLGGKIGAWTDRASDGSEVRVEHGFHAFFRHYYNLDAFLRELGLYGRMRSIGEYVIVDRKGKRWSFGGVDTTPVLNLVSLAQHGLYSLREVAFGPAGRKMDAFLRYDPERTFARLDHVSFARFAKEAELPPSLLLVFNTFARAFFADAERISMAELVKSFHFYYLSHDHGLEYDYLEGSYHHDLLEPLRERLVGHGVRIRRGEPVARIELDAASGEDEGLRVHGERFDDVVLATDVPGTRAIVEASAGLTARWPALREAVAGLRAGQRYAVLRVWIEAAVPEAALPVFVITERVRVLDAVTMLHRVEDEARAWAERHRGCVLELHCYAVPDDVPDDAIVAGMLEEAAAALPVLAEGRVVRHHLQVKADFAAFHVGMHASRPGIRSPVPGLWMCGDWVALPFPAMLMEAAYSSGLLVANAILEEAELQGFPVHAVPPKGILTTLRVPEPPA